MGLTGLTYHAGQAVTWEKIIELGYIWNLNHHFGWWTVVVNLPVTTSYDCQHLWVYKENKDGLIAADFFCLCVLWAPYWHYRNIFLGIIYKGWLYLIMVGYVIRIKKISTPV